VASSYENPEPIFEDFFRIKRAGSSNYRGATFFAFIKKSIANSKSERIALITRYSDNHCLVTRYPDSRYEKRLTQPTLPQGTPYGGAAHPLNEISLYTCRESSTNHPFLCKTNPILSAVGGLQMNVSNIITMNYKNFIPLARQKNKPNSNPIKPNLKRAKMNVNLYVIEDYRKKDDFSVQINKPNFRNGRNERKYLYHKGL